MDAQFWIYIVIGVIYFLSRLLKKPEPATGEPVDTRPPEKRKPSYSEEPIPEKPRQMTFEELLREITEGKEAERPVPQAPPRPRYESFDNELDEEAKSLEEVSVDEAKSAPVFKAYEDTTRPVFQRASLEETLQLKDTVVDFGKFKAFETEKKKNVLEDYANIIRNPKTLRQAVVMSEILKRKF